MSKVAVLLAPGYEELEAVTVIDVLRRAGVDVIIAGLVPDPIPSARNVRIVPDTTIDNLSVDDLDLDLVILPGGLPGVENLKKDERVKQLVIKMLEKGKKAAAICAAPTALACFGILRDKEATVYPALKNEISGANYKDEPVVVDGNIITSQGPGTALPFAFKLVEILINKEKAEEVANQMLIKLT